MTRIVNDESVKKTCLIARDSKGNKYLWKFWRSLGLGYWMLQDHDGYVRTLEARWIDSVPRIRLILHNYGLTSANID